MEYYLCTSCIIEQCEPMGKLSILNNCFLCQILNANYVCKKCSLGAKRCTDCGSHVDIVTKENIDNIIKGFENTPFLKLALKRKEEFINLNKEELIKYCQRK